MSVRRTVTIINLEFRPHRRRAKNPDITLTSFIDVVFTLLIFFAVSTTFSSVQDGIKLDLPEAATAEHPFEGVVVSLSETGQLFLDGRELTDLPALQSEVTTMVAAAPKLEVVVQAHRTTPYESVMSVLDAIRLGGCYSIVLEAKRLAVPQE